MKTIKLVLLLLPTLVLFLVSSLSCGVSDYVPKVFFSDKATRLWNSSFAAVSIAAAGVYAKRSCYDSGICVSGNVKPEDAITNLFYAFCAINMAKKMYFKCPEAKKPVPGPSDSEKKSKDSSSILELGVDGFSVDSFDTEASDTEESGSE